jgi:hypothetical protein
MEFGSAFSGRVLSGNKLLAPVAKAVPCRLSVLVDAEDLQSDWKMPLLLPCYVQRKRFEPVTFSNK